MSGAAERSPGGFVLKSKFRPTGDQPEAIAALYEGLRRGEDRLVLQGVTGSGKTFTMANLIAKWGRPTLILSHNKTLAAQLFAELKEFFPRNAVEYFISYYDYYQPEAYIPQTDTYIEKDASVNEEIERYRLAATNALIARRDVIVVASVSCIYGLGESDEYRGLAVGFKVRGAMWRERLLARLVEAQYVRNDYDFAPGAFRVRGDVVDIFPAYETKAIRVEFFGDEIDSIRGLDPLTGKCGVSMPAAVVTPAKQFVMGKDKFEEVFRVEGEAPRGAAPQGAHGIRHRDDARARLLQRHRELLASALRPCARLSARVPSGLFPRRLPHDHRRKPRVRPADTRDVQRRPGAQVEARRVRLPPP